MVQTRSSGKIHLGTDAHVCPVERRSARPHLSKVPSAYDCRKPAGLAPCRTDQGVCPYVAVCNIRLRRASVRRSPCFQAGPAPSTGQARRNFTKGQVK